jgi:O-antigen/teichoic acid export membrane protein
VIVCIPLFFEYLIGPLFQKGQIYALYLTIAMFLWAIYNAFIPFLLSFGKNKLIMMISIAGMAISLIGNYFNIKHLGALGAAYTSILVYFFMAAITIFFVHKHYGLGKIFKAG